MSPKIIETDRKLLLSQIMVKHHVTPSHDVVAEPLRWRAAVGHKPPKPEDESDDIRFAEIAAAAALSGALVAVARLAATRGAARWLK